MDKICGIYKIISPSGRIYIGQSININFRWEQYKKLQACNKQILLFRSFKKYGVENHVFEILEECKEAILNSRERYWQEYYNVLDFKKGLNCKLTSTKDKKGKHSKKTKQKIGKSNKGKLANKPRPYCALEKHPNARSVVCILSGKIWNCAKTCWLELFKEHFSYAIFKYQLNGKIFNRCNIYYLSEITSKEKINSLLEKYNSEITKRNSIKEKIENEKRRIKMTKEEKQIKMTQKAKEVNLKPVQKFSKNNELLQTYSSIKEASMLNDLQQSNISLCCNGKMKTSGGFIWKFKNAKNSSEGKEEIQGRYIY